MRYVVLFINIVISLAIVMGTTSSEYIYENSRTENVYVPLDKTTFKFKNCGFNESIKKNFFPEHITHIIFGDGFNKELKIGVLPKKLLFLEFGHDFNQDIIPRVLPPTLKTIHFGTKFNMDITEKVLPEGLQYLKLGSSFKKSVSLPASLTTIEIYGNINDKGIVDNLPSSVNTLIINNLSFEITNLPSTIGKIILPYYNRAILSFIKKIPHGTKVFDEDQDIELIIA